MSPRCQVDDNVESEGEAERRGGDQVKLYASGIKGSESGRKHRGVRIIKSVGG